MIVSKNNDFLCYMLTISFAVVCWTIMTCIYSKVSLNLLLAMYKNHRDAFKSHFKSMIAIYIASMLSFGFIIGNEVYDLYSVICAYGLVNGEYFTAYFDVL